MMTPLKHNADRPSVWRRLELSLGPILAGVMLDMVDFATMGPVALFLGGGMGLWMCWMYRLPILQSLFWAVIAGFYCMAPFTRYLPLATLFGAYMRFRDLSRKDQGS